MQYLCGFQRLFLCFLLAHFSGGYLPIFRCPFFGGLLAHFSGVIGAVACPFLGVNEYMIRWNILQIRSLCHEFLFLHILL